MSRVFGTAKLVDGYWNLQVEPHVAIKLKRVFKRIGKQFGTIKIKDSDEVCRDLVWFTDRYPLEVEQVDYLHDQAVRFDTRTSEFASVLSGKIEPRDFEMAMPLRDYQRVAADLALRTRGLLVADDLGLGKTAVGIATLTMKQNLPALVVTLTPLPNQWAREIQKFVPGMRVHVVEKGTPYDIVKARRGKKKRKRRGQVVQIALFDDYRFPDVVIMNYHKLRGWAETLAPVVNSVIFDEVQELRRSGSAKYEAARHIRANVWLALGLSATPIYNVGGEMFNVADILRPDMLGEWSEFAEEWLLSGYMDRSKAPVEDPEAFGTYLREQGFMIRRTRAEVGRELPPLLKVMHYVESDPHAFEAVEEDIRELAKIVLSRNTTRLERRDAGGTLDWKLRQATGIAKAPYVAQFVSMLIESGVEKVLLYGWHREVYSIWMSKLKSYNPVMYTGTESVRQKEKALGRFLDRSVEGSQVLIMSLRAGAGLDGLQEGCNVMVFGELDWSPGVHDQCTGRPHRDGQREEVTAYYLVTDDGSDPVIADVLGLKRTQIEGIVNVGEGALLEKLDSGGADVKRMAREYLLRRGEPV